MDILLGEQFCVRQGLEQGAAGVAMGLDRLKGDALKFGVVHAPIIASRLKTRRIDRVLAPRAPGLASNHEHHAGDQHDVEPIQGTPAPAATTAPSRAAAAAAACRHGQRGRSRCGIAPSGSGHQVIGCDRIGVRARRGAGHVQREIARSIDGNDCASLKVDACPCRAVSDLFAPAQVVAGAVAPS